MTRKIINLDQARKQRDAAREAELERRVIERWTGPRGCRCDRGEHCYQHCNCDACRKRWDE